MRSPFAYAATDLAPSNRADTSKRVALEVVDKRRTIVEAIDRTQLFAALPPEARVFLAERAEIRRYKQGELVGSQGTGRGAMFCVVSGRLRGIKYSPEGRRLIYMHLDPGQWAGFYWAEDDGTAVMDTEAAEPSVCVLIAGDVLAIAGRRWPALYERLYRELLRRTRPLYGVMELCVAHPLRVRVALTLLNLLETHQRETPTGIRLDISVSQSELAAMSFCSRQHLNKVLRVWASQGIVDNVGPKEILVKNVDALRQEARQSGFAG
ncbi:MAG TPA: Crp/Fnr family transcriptional regulator [Nevskiaceae bacterium]|nr:Crp/Fnr family transcriptional regulator [Nevskiaceae bacterium]